MNGRVRIIGRYLRIGLIFNMGELVFGKKVAVGTWCTDDYIDYIGIESLSNSIKYFHPEIVHEICDSYLTTKLQEAHPWMQPVWMMAASKLDYLDEYDMIIHLDGDCVVVGPLDELISSSEDIIGTRNNNSMGRASAGGPKGHQTYHNYITGLDLFGNMIDWSNFINAGVVGVNNLNVWKVWHRLNFLSAINQLNYDDEQATLNALFHNNDFTNKIVDSKESDVFYNVSSSWGNEYPNHWDSWKELYIKDDGLYLNDFGTNKPKRVKVLHQAGGDAATEINKKFGGFRKWLEYILPSEVNEYISWVCK